MLDRYAPGRAAGGARSGVEGVDWDAMMACLGVPAECHDCIAEVSRQQREVVERLGGAVVALDGANERERQGALDLSRGCGALGPQIRPLRNLPECFVHP